MAEEKAAKIKRKKWVQIIAPELLRNEVIGEIPVIEPNSLIGRIVTTNLMNITRDIKKQNTSLKLIITNIKGGKAVTDFYGYYLNANSIKRLVRRGKEKIGISIICKTSDNKKIRIMPLIIPHQKVKNSIATSYRKDAKNYLASYIAKTTLSNIIKDLIMNKLQRDLKGALKKIYPVRILEIAKVHIETEKKPGAELKIEEPKEEIKEEKAEEKKEEPKAEVKEEVKEEKQEKTEEEKAEEEKPENKVEVKK